MLHFLLVAIMGSNSRRPKCPRCANIPTMYCSVTVDSSLKKAKNGSLQCKGKDQNDVMNRVSFWSLLVTQDLVCAISKSKLSTFVLFVKHLCFLV